MDGWSLPNVILSVFWNIHGLLKLQNVQFDEQRYNLIPENKSTYIMDNQSREIVIYNPEMKLGA